MELQDFLQRVLPVGGNYYSARILHNGKLRQKKVTSITGLATEIAMVSQGRMDAYFATASFSDKRRISDITLKRAWYVDIDCVPGKQYDDKKRARVAIRQALNDGLPPPTLMVDSGNGYHLYWTTSDEVTYSQWGPYASALENACTQHKLSIDTGITTDAARILRAPGTTNYKIQDAPVPCVVAAELRSDYTFDELATAFNSYLTQPAVVAITSIGGIGDDDLSAGLPEGVAPKAELMLKLCPMLASTAINHGKDQPGVLWHKILHTLAFCDDGEKYIHALSDGHDSYNAKKVDQRFKYALEQRRLRPEIGPTRCDKFAEHAVQCATCKWRAQIKSPIKLAFGVPHDLPFPFRNSEHGVERKHSEEGWLRAIRYNVENFTVAPSGERTEIRMDIDKSHISASLDDFVDNYCTRKVLAKYTLMLDTSETESLRQLMTAWIEQLRKSDSISDTMLATKQYGWVGKGFKYNGIYYGPDKSQTPTFVIDKTLDDMYKSVGDLSKWSACANHILSQYRPAAWCAVASAFAAPLTIFTGTSGSLLSIISRRTGTGKTTALKVALAVWAHPQRAMSSLDDTVNSINKKMGVLNSLPVYWDEVRGRADVQKFTATVFRLSQGKEKQRLDANLSQRKSGDWATMLTIASNESLQDHLSHILGGTDAGAARVFELDVDTGLSDGMNNAQARHFYRQLESNYGNAGVVYAQYIAAHHDEVEQLVKKVDSAMAEKLKSTSGERFWVATITTIVTGAMIANKLSLCQFDIKKLTAYLIREFQRMRVTLARENPVGGTHAKDMLTRFIHEQKDYTIISSNQARRSRATDGAIIYMDSERQPATIRLARDENTIRLLRQDFKSWVYDQEGAGGSHILRDLSAMGVKEVQGSIDAGTARGMGTRHRCLEFELVGEFAHLSRNDEDDDSQNGDLG